MEEESSKKSLVDELRRLYQRIDELERSRDGSKGAQESFFEKGSYLKAVFLCAMDGLFVIDMEGRYKDVNPAGCAMFGYTLDEFLKSDIRILLFPDDVDAAFERGKRHWREGAFVPEYRMRKKDGSEIWVEMTVNPFKIGEKEYCLGVKRDITGRRLMQRALQRNHEDLERKVIERAAELLKLNDMLDSEVKERRKAEEILRSVVQGTSAFAGDDFLRSLVRHLATALKFRYALVGELVGDRRDNVRTLAVWAVDGPASNFIYELEGTPCETVIRLHKSICWYPSNVRELFPDDKLLADMGVESYVGVPLVDSEGKILGILAALDDKAMASKSDPTGILTVFASRAAFELERKRLEDERRKASEMLQAIIDNSAAVIFLKDRDGRYLFVNRHYERLFNVKREDLIGKTDYDVFPKELSDVFVANDKKVMDAGRPIEFEERALHADGTTHIYLTIKFQLQAIPGSICGIATDITERKLSLERLKLSEERLKAAERIAKLGCWDWDIAGNRLYWSDETYRIFGLSPGEFGPTYEVFLTYVHPDDRDFVKNAVNGALYDGKPYSIDHRIVLSGGGERIVHEQAAVTLDKDGVPVRMVGTVHDVTEIKKTQEELLRAQKLETIGSLAGGIAHDFNNILMGIIGNISVAREYLKDGDKMHGILTDMEKAAMRAKNVAKRLLTFSKGGEPVKETVPVTRLIRDSAEIVLSGSNVACDFAFPQDLWRVDIDEGQMTQVFNNVILNAMQAMPDGGTVKISAENFTAAEKDGVPVDKGDYVKITVIDHGVGIPGKDIRKVFDPFFTTKEKASGLGLAVSYSIVKKHNGYISVESEDGSGTAFSIYLPSAERREATARPLDQSAPKGKGRVLVMDDEEIVRDVAGEMLKLLGYEAAFALDGAEAVGMYKQALLSGEPFRAVIMDLTIPAGMGGKEAIKKLIDIDPGVKAIVSSGYSSDPIMSEYKKYGFKGVITKPYRVAEFGNLIKSVIEGK